MRLARLRSLLSLVVFIAIVGAVAGCNNPFDPLKSSDKIEGLTYVDFAAVQEHWDSDPDWDGVQITLSYFNEFSDTLSFHDKSHKVQIEFWSSKDSSGTPVIKVRDKFLTSKTVEFANSDDFIRIPIEYYGGLIGIDPVTPVDITGCMVVRIFPPQEYPQKELIAPIQCGVNFFTAEVVPP